MKDQNEVTYRQLAKVFAKGLPVAGKEFGDLVDRFLVEIKAMPQADKNALRAAYIFSAKAPREEREDLFQELTLKLLEARAGDEALCYSIARCDWQNWWAKYKIRCHFSLNTKVADDDGNVVEWGELLVGVADFEERIIGDLDGESLLNQLPSWVAKLVYKRLIGHGITGGERRLLDKWVLSRPTVLARYTA